MENNRKVIIPARLSYANIWEPKQVKGGPEKYSVSLIIPKSDTKTIEAIEKAVEAALQDGVGKFGGKIPPRGSLKLPLRDGDTDRDDEAYADCYFINASTQTPPQIVDQRVQPVLDRAEVYSGCYGNVSVTFYPFNVDGNRGVAAGLGNIQKVRDGDPLGGAPTRAADEFEAVSVEDDFLN